MRVNRFVAVASGLSRRAADKAVADGRVRVDGRLATNGQDITAEQRVTLDDRAITPPVKSTTVLLHKPSGYVCSRRGQGSRTIYDLLPTKLHHLKSVGRLDKDSSGLLLLTDDGRLAHELTHPSRQKVKIYLVDIDKPLTAGDQEAITAGIRLMDGPSRLILKQRSDDRHWEVHLREGRNRQIRRTFQALGYRVTKLHRLKFGDYILGRLPPGEFRTV